MPLYLTCDRVTYGRLETNDKTHSERDAVLMETNEKLLYADFSLSFFFLLGSSIMAERTDIRQLFVKLKDTLTKELKELKDELKDFRHDTERDIRMIMQQTTDLNQKLWLTTAQVDQLEAWVSNLDDVEIENEKTTKWLNHLIKEVLRVPGEPNIIQAHRTYKERQDSVWPIITLCH